MPIKFSMPMVTTWRGLAPSGGSKRDEHWAVDALFLGAKTGDKWLGFYDEVDMQVSNSSSDGLCRDNTA